MLSLLSRTFVVSKSGIPGPTISCLPTVWRFFSQSHVKCAAPEDPEARRKRLDRINERFRQRYDNDHDFRKKMLSYMHAKRHSDDPVQREHGINLMKQCVDRWRTRHPEAWAESQRKYRLVQAARYANDPRHAFLKKLRRWLVYHADHADAVEDLPWRAHVPVFYGEKILRRCAGRDRLSHLGNFKLWYVHAAYVLIVDAAIFQGLCNIICKQRQADHVQVGVTQGQFQTRCR